MSGDHDHGRSRPADPDLWRVLEILVWLSVGVLLVIFVEWAGGYIARKNIVSGAQRLLRKQAQESEST
jgi:hypothetical protein